jgi:hypothetical protein
MHPEFDPLTHLETIFWLETTTIVLVELVAMYGSIATSLVCANFNLVVVRADWNESSRI